MKVDLCGCSKPVHAEGSIFNQLEVLFSNGPTYAESISWLTQTWHICLSEHQAIERDA